MWTDKTLPTFLKFDRITNYNKKYSHKKALDNFQQKKDDALARRKSAETRSSLDKSAGYSRGCLYLTARFNSYSVRAARYLYSNHKGFSSW